MWKNAILSQGSMGSGGAVQTRASWPLMIWVVFSSSCSMTRGVLCRSDVVDSRIVFLTRIVCVPLHYLAQQTDDRFCIASRCVEKASASRVHIAPSKMSSSSGRATTLSSVLVTLSIPKSVSLDSLGSCSDVLSAYPARDAEEICRRQESLQEFRTTLRSNLFSMALASRSRSSIVTKRRRRRSTY